MDESNKIENGMNADQTQIELDELERLKAVLEYNIDYFSVGISELDSITKFTANICKCPISIITLIDSDKIICKSKFGIMDDRYLKCLSICTETIKGDSLLLIPDTFNDPFAHNHPNVTEFPFVRFYAGFPLISPSGLNVGTICVIDFVPRTLSKNQLDFLPILSKHIINFFELHKRRRELEQANKNLIENKYAKEEFLTKMSHELRTPLNAIQGYSELLLKTKLDKDQKDMVKIINNSAEILLSIISDVLDFTRMECGKLEINKESFKLKDILKHLRELFLPKCLEKNLDFKMNVDKEVPKVVVGDESRLLQIMINLVSNAIKFTTKGSILISIKSIKDCKNSTMLAFSVTDTGKGIKDDKLEYIFLRFEQQDVKTRQSGESGYGLNICKRLIEMHGGELKIKTKEDFGSSVFFEISYDKPNHKQLINFEEEINDNVIYTFKNLKVLVCEDNTINIKLISKILKNHKIYHEIAVDGKKAIDILNKNKNFDLIFMDLQMPIMNGLDTTKYIRNEMKLTLPIMALTANYSDIDKQICFDMGMNDYVSKPFKIKDLFKTISKLCPRLTEITKNSTETLNQSSNNDGCYNSSDFDCTETQKISKQSKFINKDLNSFDITQSHDLDTSSNNVKIQFISPTKTSKSYFDSDNAKDNKKKQNTNLFSKFHSTNFKNRDFVSSQTKIYSNSKYTKPSLKLGKSKSVNLLRKQKFPTVIDYTSHSNSIDKVISPINLLLIEKLTIFSSYNQTNMFKSVKSINVNNDIKLNNGDLLCKNKRVLVHPKKKIQSSTNVECKSRSDMFNVNKYISPTHGKFNCTKNTKVFIQSPKLKIYKDEITNKFKLKKCNKQLTILEEDINENLVIGRNKDRKNSKNPSNLELLRNDRINEKFEQILLNSKEKRFKENSKSSEKMENGLNTHTHVTKNILEENNLTLIKNLEENKDFENVNFDCMKEISGEDEEFEKEMIETFLKETPDQMLKLTEAINNENGNINFEEIKLLAHTIKSSVAFFGLLNTKDKFKKIEEISCGSHKIKEIHGIFIQIKNQLSYSYCELRNKF